MKLLTYNQMLPMTFLEWLKELQKDAEYRKLMQERKYALKF